MSRALTPGEFAERFEAAWRPLWCIAASTLGERAGADDVVQDAAIVGLGKLEEFDPSTSFLAWMGQVVRFVALNHRRKEQRRPGGSLRGGGGLGDPEVMDHVIASDQHSTVRPVSGSRPGKIPEDRGHFDDEVVAALRALEETARACLLMRTQLDLSYKEIAETLGIPEGTAMSHVHRARATLRERLAPAAAGVRAKGGHA